MSERRAAPWVTSGLRKKKRKKKLTEKWQIYERGAWKQLSSCHVAICGVDQWRWLYLVCFSWHTFILINTSICVGQVRCAFGFKHPEHIVAKHATVTAQTRWRWSNCHVIISSIYQTFIRFFNPDRRPGWTANHDLDPCPHTLLHDVKTPDSCRWKLFALVTQKVPTGSKSRKRKSIESNSCMDFDAHHVPPMYKNITDSI